MNSREKYERIISEMPEETLLNALIVLGAMTDLSSYQAGVQADLCREAETRFPATEELMASWIGDDKREGTYPHALVAAVLAVKEFGV